MKQKHDESVEWYTPDHILDLVRKYAPIGLDPCSSGRDRVNATKFYTKADDGLSQPWDELGMVFMNPPYGRGIGKWVFKAAMVRSPESPVIALLPSRTGTKWFQELVLGSPRYPSSLYTSQVLCFVKGRIPFVDGNGDPSNNGGKFDSVIVGYDVVPYDFKRIFKEIGTVVTI